MAVEPEEGGKLAHGRIQPALPGRAKTRRQTITTDGTPGSLCLSNPGRRQTAIFLLQTDYIQTDTIEIPGTEILGRIFNTTYSVTTETNFCAASVSSPNVDFCSRSSLLLRRTAGRQDARVKTIVR